MRPALRQKSISVLLMASLFYLPLPAQEPTFSSNVKVVNVLASVRDKKGKIVHDLAKEDFQLEEDGRPQTIRYFSQESDIPLTLGLLVDTSVSQRNVLVEERAASYAFLNSMLREDRDQAFVIHFDFEVQLLQDLTSSRRHLEAALDQLEIPDQPWRRNFQRRGSGRFPGGGGRRRGGGQPRTPSGGIGTQLYDAVYLAADEMMKPVTGRKAVIILSDGEDYGSKVSLEECIAAAQRRDTVVYSILYSDSDGGLLNPASRRGRGKQVLEQMSKETGGRMFKVSRNLGIREVYAQIEEELRNQYSLGYSSDRQDEGTAYRRIAVKTRRKDLVVQARDGYYPNQQMKLRVSPAKAGSSPFGTLTPPFPAGLMFRHASRPSHSASLALRRRRGGMADPWLREARGYEWR